MPSALLFDMDGLLLDTERPIFQAFVDLAGEIGLEDGAAIGRSMVGLSSELCRRKLRALLPESLSLDEFWDRWDAGIRDTFAAGIPLKPGVATLLPELSDAGHRMAVVTSTGTGAATARLERAGLLGHVILVVGGDDVTAHKPDPAPYLAAADRLGLSASDCAAFEDSDIGVASAVAAGCRLYQVPDILISEHGVRDQGQVVCATLAEALRAAGCL